MLQEKNMNVRQQRKEGIQSKIEQTQYQKKSKAYNIKAEMNEQLEILNM